MDYQGSFPDLINGKTPVLVEFSAEWCGPCKAMTPILGEVAAEMGDELRIIKIDVDQNPELTQQMGIQGIPSFFLYYQGQLKWRHAGMQSAHALLKAIELALHMPS